MNLIFVIDGLMGAAWTAVNACLLLAIVGLQKRYFPRVAGAGLALDIVTLYLASVVGVLTCLGVLGLFSSFGLLAAMGGASASMLMIAYQGRSAPERASTERAASGVECRSSLKLAAWLLALCLLLGHVVADGLLRFPKDYDCLMYHLPLIDHWLQSGSLYAPDSANWFLSANSELVGAWITGVFSGDFLAPMNNVPVLIMWAAAAVELGRRLGMRGLWPHLSAASTLAVQTTIHQSDDASNDVMVVACCLSAAVYTLRCLSVQSPSYFAMLGIAVGLLAGVKYYAIGYAVVIIAALFAALWRSHGISAAVKGAATACAFAIPFGGYWYVRNVVITGLPLYPLGSTPETPGIGYPGLWSTTLAGNGNPEVPNLALQAIWKMCGPVHLLAVVLTLGIVVGLVADGLLRRRSRDARACRTTSQLLALWILGSLAVLFVTPFSVEDEPGTLNHLRWAYTPVRYGLCYLSFTTIAFFALTASFAQRLERRSGRSALVLCIALVSWQWAQRLALSSDIDLTVAVLIGSNVFLLACVLGVSTWRRSRRLCLAGTIALAALMGLGTALLSSRWHLGLASHFNDAFSTALFAHIERKWPDGATVHVYATRPYPFFGSLRQNRVIHPRSAPSTDESLSGSLACEIVVVERDDRNPVSRYRGIYELLSESTAYESIEPSAGGVYVAFRRNVAMAKDGD